MEKLYPIILAIHNILRWAILLSGLYVLFRTYRGWLKSLSWNEAEKKAGTLFTITLDSQILVGLILYFALSPLTKTFFTNFSTGVDNATSRFFGIEHSILMIVALVFAHYANILTKRNIDNTDKFKRAAIFYTIAFLIILIAVPWTTRPLLPF